MRVLVVDDEPIVRRDLSRLLGEEPDVVVAGTAGDGREALDLIHTTQPDVVLLDVEMPELNGIEVVRALESDTAPLIVFVTAHDHYAIAAFEAEAIDYLLKPFNGERLRRALDRVRARLKDRSTPSLSALQEMLQQPESSLQWLAVRTNDGAVVVAAEDIVRVEASGNYVKLHLQNASYLSRRTMADLEKQLDPARFVRVHRSHIIAIKYISKYRLLGDGDAQVELRTGTRVTVARSHRQAVERRLGGIA